MADLLASMEQFNGKSQEEKTKELYAWFDELKEKDKNFDKARWPEYNREKLSDCIGRNILAAMIVQDPGKQSMRGGRYDHSDEVKEVCNNITSAGTS